MITAAIITSTTQAAVVRDPKNLRAAPFLVRVEPPQHLRREVAA